MKKMRKNPERYLYNVQTHARLIGQGLAHCIGMYWWHEWATSPVYKTV